METNNRKIPSRAVHPGEILRGELKERGLKQVDFAKKIGIRPAHLNEFIKGHRNLNSNLAIKLEEHLAIPYKIWMDLHAGYLYDSATIDAKKSLVEYEIKQNKTSYGKPSVKGYSKSDVSSAVRRETEMESSVSNRILELMTERGISKSELAYALGKRPCEVTKWLSGQHNFTIRTLAQLSVALGENIMIVPSSDGACLLNDQKG